jgi:hypothetical protein
MDPGRYYRPRGIDRAAPCQGSKLREDQGSSSIADSSSRRRPLGAPCLAPITGFPLQLYCRHFGSSVKLEETHARQTFHGEEGTRESRLTQHLGAKSVRTVSGSSIP